jgi:hypothetical protein
VTMKKDTTITFSKTRSISDPTPLAARKVPITLNWSLIGSGDTVTALDTTFQFYLQCGAFGKGKFNFSSKINRDTSSYRITNTDSSYTIYYPLPGIVKPAVMRTDTSKKANAVLSTVNDSGQVSFKFDDFVCWISVDAICSLPIRIESYSKKDSLISRFTVDNDFNYYASFNLESRYYW